MNEENKKILKDFKKSPQKIHFLCKCSDSSVELICDLISSFCNHKIPLKNLKKVTRKCRKFKKDIRYLCKPSSKASHITRKRQVLIDICKIIFPILTNDLIPFICKQNE